MMDENKLKAIINELGRIRGRHTELVTVYVPAGYNMIKVAEQIKSEQGTAQNIKSKTVRKNVVGALEKITQHLKLYKQTPKNGVAIFCGNVSDKEGVTDLELWAIEPPETLKQRLYRCGQEFVLDPLKEMVREKEVYGLIVLDKSEAEIGLLKGKRIESLKHLDSIVPGKTKAGGWSQQRYARIREGLLNDFLKKIGEIASSNFKGMRDLKGIIVGGPGPVKEQFVDGDYLEYSVKNKVLGVVNTSYTGGEYGLRETVERAEDIISEASAIREKKVLERFFTELSKDSSLAVYGFREVVNALKSGNLELLLLSEGFDWVKTKFKCSCGFETEKVLNREQIDEQKCPECNNKFEVTGERDLTEDLIKIADDMGTEADVISTNTGMGEQLMELGGIGGILRYKS
ncbi:MAG: peptide chain release factor 1 [Candidatus Aenigmarchaeota archaeon]|nr:peptide chain release factor 1 [Candidatus Aenigmarchaeota archaeon]